jgi:hypothetical protein
MWGTVAASFLPIRRLLLANLLLVDKVQSLTLRAGACSPALSCSRGRLLAVPATMSRSCWSQFVVLPIDFSVDRRINHSLDYSPLSVFYSLPCR